MQLARNNKFMFKKRKVHIYIYNDESQIYKSILVHRKGPKKKKKKNKKKIKKKFIPS